MALLTDQDTQDQLRGAETFWRLPIGAASPLWAAYAAMAGFGISYWWMSRLAKPVHLEAWQGLMRSPQLPAIPVAAGLPAVLAEAPSAAETLVALQPEPVAPPVEPVVEPEAPEAQIAEAGIEAVQQAQEAAGEAAMAASLAADDLTRLVGIGPSLAGRLANLGVRTFADIAAWTDEDLEKMNKALDLKGRAVRERWVDQARQFAAQ